MTIDIYWFSGTGDSLSVARDIAEKTGGRLIRIASQMDRDRIRTEAEAIGIVFPVYYASLGDSGLPGIARRFVGKLDDLGSKYVFAVCTHRGAPVSTIENMRRLVASHGGDLACGFTVQLSTPYSAGQKMKHTLFHRELKPDVKADDREARRLFASWNKKLEFISLYVTSRRRGEYETRGRLVKAVLTPWISFQRQMGIARYRRLSDSSHGAFEELVPIADKRFETDSRCNGCGLCAKICPVDNIQISNGKPVWLHHCESCYACFQWCPRQAIEGDIVEYEKRYHHPSVMLSDLLRSS
jgi:ferredoxin